MPATTDAPQTRTLTAVLRRALDTGPQLRLVIGRRGLDMSGADPDAYVNVIIEGVTVKVPYFRGTDIGAAGDVAYVLAAPDFLVFLGVVRSGPLPPP